MPEAINGEASLVHGEIETGVAAAPARAAERPVAFWAVLAAALISIPALFGGFSGDDLVQRLVLEGQAPGYALSPLRLYDFTPPELPAPVLIERGMFPWFASPELSLRFLRPVSSASLALDHALFGRSALLSHLQSWLWVVLLAGTAASLYQRWFTRGAALASALVFALSTVHGAPTAWLASRHTLIAAALSALALWSWVRFREDGRRAFAALAPVFLLGSLLASESGLVGVALLASYELGVRGLRRGLLGAAPFVMLGGVYLVAYVLLGYGVRGSSFYVSPFGAPLEYARLALWSVPALCAELLLGVPSALAGFFPEARVPTLIAGLVAALAVAAILVGLRAQLQPAARRTLGWLAAWAFIGTFGLIGAPVTGRVLPLPELGAAALVGNALWLLWSRSRGAPPGASAPRARRWYAALVPLALLQLGLSPLLRVGGAVQFRQMARTQQRLAEQAELGACARGGSLYLLTGADPNTALYAAAALAFYTPDKARAERLRVLAMVPQRLELGRPEPTVLTLEVLDPPRRDNPFERLYRPADAPLLAGSTVELPELRVRVEAADDGVFNRARFEFRRELEGNDICLLAMRGGRLEALAVPPVGQRVIIAHEPGPMGL